MPRLSIIIPHRSNDHRLEETILSVLENRPRDCEIIVVHDGSYLDPYQLDDEVVYVQEEPKSSVIELLNAGLMAACSPVVCALLDGVVVSANWSEPAMRRFTRAEVTCVAPQLQIGREVVSGIASSALRSVSKLRAGRCDASETGEVAAPTLTAGFYRRKTLLALGGWNDSIGSSTADIELALVINDLELACECEPNSLVTAQAEGVPNRKSNVASYELAGIAVAHGLASANSFAAVQAIVSGCFTGRLASAWSWASGLLSRNAGVQMITRLQRAKQQFGLVGDAGSIKAFSNADTHSESVSRQHRNAA